MLSPSWIGNRNIADFTPYLGLGLRCSPGFGIDDRPHVSWCPVVFIYFRHRGEDDVAVKADETEVVAFFAAFL